MDNIAARKALILKLANNYDWSASNFTEGQQNAMVEATENITLDALRIGVSRFMHGEVVGQNNSRMPSGADLAIYCRMLMPREHDPNDPTSMLNLVSYPMGEKPPKGMVPAGLLSVDFGDRRGRVNMARLSYKEQERVMRGGSVPKTITVGAAPKLRSM